MENTKNTQYSKGPVVDLEEFVQPTGYEEIGGTKFPTLKFTLPSGNWVVIREQNGEDEDILSNARLHRKGKAINLFLSSIILEHSKYVNKDLTPEDTEDFLVIDRYFIVLMSRIFSYGPELEFEHEWDSGDEFSESKKETFKYKENLFDFIWDLEQPLPEEGDDMYNEGRIRKYPFGDQREFEFETSRGRKVRFKNLTGRSEKKAKKLGHDGARKMEFQMRELQVYDPKHDQWLTPSSLASFPSREVAEIRSKMSECDYNWMMEVKIDHPETGEVDYIPLITIPNFFFPLDQI